MYNGDMDVNPANQQQLGWYGKSYHFKWSIWYNAFGHETDTSTE